MEVIVILAAAVLLWMAWQLLRAKQFTRFKQFLKTDIQPRIILHIKESLIDSRSELIPNNAFHIEATTLYWTTCHGRILQYALAHEIMTKEELMSAGQYRFSQHLFHIEAAKLHRNYLGH